ncbi:LOW QUALITY PROTEIN: hypothetical protein PanWU01x14_319590 [Parasponia andersonii]|uniref:Uncharacterized protein n=1 Tax=Parasponia andersonii TaxID=3476 RepID=A0A2P5AM03_PARAD|nr:LOW QUALITY PROTEIN: hypothetical protein PanWU01x14_319590 [Parasponia andersonii]
MLPMISYFLTYTCICKAVLYEWKADASSEMLFFISTLMEFFFGFRGYSDWTTMRHCSFLMQMIITDLERGGGAGGGVGGE